MLKKTMTYTDYNGQSRTEDFYFNLTKAELVEMGLSENGGLDVFIQKIIDERDQKEIIRMFKNIILKAYGEKSLDGKHFIKVDPAGNRVCDQFAQTEAFSDLFMELAFNAKAASDFINALVPSDMGSAIEALSKS